MTGIRLGLVISVASAIVFGLYPPCIQIALRDGANSTFTIIVSTFFRALVLVLFCLYQGYQVIPVRKEWRSYVSGGFFQSLAIVGILGSLAFVPGPVTITIMFTHTLLLLFFLVFIGEERLTFPVIVATAGSLMGVSLVVNVWNIEGGMLNANGVLLAVLASFATAIRLYIFGKQVKDTKPALVGARIYSTTFIFTLCLLSFDAPVLPATFNGLLWFFIGVGSLVIGSFGMFYGISLLGSFRFSLLVKLEPIFTAFFSLLILKEGLIPIQYAGIVMVITCLVGYQLYGIQKKVKNA